MNLSVRRMVESAILIAIGTVLSLFTFTGPWALGGGITLCSMLPLVIIAHRYGTKWGMFSAFAYSILQALLGASNLGYAPDFLTWFGILFLDYILPFSVIGLSAMFNGVIKNKIISINFGILVTFIARFIMHFISGWIIWESLWPNELGWAAPLWSLAYNGSYMLPEMIITCIIATLSFKPLKKFWLREDISK